MTTAKFRNLAYEADRKGDYEKAFMYYNKAIKAYPPQLLKGSLYNEDLRSLENKRALALEGIKLKQNLKKQDALREKLNLDPGADILKFFKP